MQLLNSQIILIPDSKDEDSDNEENSQDDEAENVRGRNPFDLLGDEDDDD